jgi:hypothetical protein
MKRLLFALALLLSANIVRAQLPIIPAANLIHWYPFCTSTDLFDRTFTGFDLLSANVTSTTDRFPSGSPSIAQGKAYNFNGINSEIHYTTTFTIPLFGIADFSYSCHIYPTALQDAIILYNGNPALDGLGIIMNDGTFGGGPGNQVSMLFGGLAQSAGVPVTLNQWHHLVLKRNGNSYLFFVDGLQAAVYVPVGIPAGGYNPPTGVFQLGMDFTNLVKAYTGKIDDIAIYDRQISTAEVTALKNFNPNIYFDLGNDTALCANQITFGARTIDTVSYPNTTVVPPPYGFHYKWSTGPIDTTTSSTVTFPSTPTLPDLRTLTITRDSSCPSTHAIRTTHIIPHVNIGRDTTFCSGDSLLLNPTPATAPGMVYMWSTGETTPSIWVEATGTYWLKVDSTPECVATDTANLVVSPIIHATLIPDTTLCYGGTIAIGPSDTASYVNPHYIWSDLITTTPTFDVVSSGTYWVKVTDSACSATDTVKIAIVYDTLTVFNPDTAICKGQVVTVRATYSPEVTYQWRPSSGIPVSSIPTPTITPDTSAMYILEGTIILDGELLSCRTRDSFFIDVHPTPKVNMGGNRNICKYDTIIITPEVSPSWFTGYTYDWSPGTFLDDSTAPSVIFTAGDTTKLVLIVSTPGPAFCTSADSIIIYKYNGNFASMSTDTSLCPGDSVQLFPVSTEPGTTYYNWNPPTYIDNPYSGSPIIKPINSISYNVIATSQYGCKDTLNYAIVVKPSAVIHVRDSAVLFPGQTYHIEPYTNCTRHSWSPPIGLDDTASSNPVANPPVSTKYIVTGYTDDGCKTVDSISIRVSEFSLISVPNAFVPGSGPNGQLKVILDGIARLRYFRIYNRYGNMVFEGKNINSGWDGTINDVPQPMGVFVYEAEAITSDGKIIHKQGNVTLLR